MSARASVSRVTSGLISLYSHTSSSGTTGWKSVDAADASARGSCVISVCADIHQTCCLELVLDYFSVST